MDIHSIICWQGVAEGLSQGVILLMPPGMPLERNRGTSSRNAPFGTVGNLGKLAANSSGVGAMASQNLNVAGVCARASFPAAMEALAVELKATLNSPGTR